MSTAFWDRGQWYVRDDDEVVGDGIASFVRVSPSLEFIAKLPPQPGRVVVRPAGQLRLVLGLEDRVAVPDLADLLVSLGRNGGPL